MHFHSFAIISPWRGTIPFFWTSLNLLYPRMICAKSGLNWPSGSGEDLSMAPLQFYIFVIISPLKKTWLFIWTNLIPFTQGEFAPSLIEFGLLVLEKKIFKNFQCIFTLLLPSPLREGYPFRLNKLESPLPKDELCQVWSIKIGPVVLKKKIFKWPHPIFTFLWLSPLWRGPGPLFEQTWIPITQG